MLRALRRRCAGPTLRILVIGVEGAEPTPSVHPSEEPEEPTGCSSRACSTPPARRRSVSGTAAAGTDSARHAAVRAAKQSSGVRAVQSVMSAAGFAWFPGGRAGRRARCRRSLRRPRDPREWEHAVIRAPDNYAGPGKLRRPGGRHLPRKPSREAAGQPPADLRVVSDRGVYPGGDAAGERSGRCAAGMARSGSAWRRGPGSPRAFRAPGSRSH